MSLDNAKYCFTESYFEKDQTNKGTSAQLSSVTNQGIAPCFSSPQQYLCTLNDQHMKSNKLQDIS